MIELRILVAIVAAILALSILPRLVPQPTVINVHPDNRCDVNGRSVSCQALFDAMERQR